MVIDIDFNPRTRVGCDQLTGASGSTTTGFQSTHPGGVRLTPGTTMTAPVRFQSTHPGGVRRRERRRRRKSPRFQSTHPGGVRPLHFNSGSQTITDFNPRTRVGCDKLILYFSYFVFIISIHAPGWGATDEGVQTTLIHAISIHAPGWGATLPWAGLEVTRCISIHAPGWGATILQSQRDYLTAISIHAPGWGATTRKRSCGSIAKFQSTHPGGVRLYIFS